MASLKCSTASAYLAPLNVATPWFNWSRDLSLSQPVTTRIKARATKAAPPRVALRIRIIFLNSCLARGALCSISLMPFFNPGRHEADFVDAGSLGDIDRAGDGLKFQ